MAYIYLTAGGHSQGGGKTAVWARDQATPAEVGENVRTVPGRRQAVHPGRRQLGRPTAPLVEHDGHPATGVDLLRLRQKQRGAEWWLAGGGGPTQQVWCQDATGIVP